MPAGKLHRVFKIVKPTFNLSHAARSVRMTAARRLQHALSESATGAEIMHRFAASQRAARAISSECQRIVPDLEPSRCGVCDLRNGTLRLNARSTAQLSKLRQALPRLLTQLRQQGLDVSEIKLGVQPRPLSSSDRADPHSDRACGTAQTGVDLKSESNRKAAREFASKLALTLPESPLKQAVDRLLQSLSGGIAKTRD